MKKALWIILCIFLTICILTSKRHTVRNGLYENIMACDLQHDGDTAAININNFIHFEWDRFYIFYSFVSYNQIGKEIGFFYGKKNRDKLAVAPDDNRRFIFINNNEIVYEEDISTHHKKYIGNFPVEESHSFFTTPYFCVKLRIGSQGKKIYNLYPITEEEYNQYKK